MKPLRKEALAQPAPADQPSSRVFGNTIIAVPHPGEMQQLCLDDGGTGWPQPGGQKLFKIRLADSVTGHRKSASFLVKRRYAWRGYDVGGGVLGVQPNRITLSACDRDETIATISVGLDSVIGLFVDQLYRKEVDRVRAQYRRVCEFTKLAIDGSIRSKQVLASLFHIAYIHARRVNYCTDLFVEVNPRHVLFYKRMLGFTQYGAERLDARVQAPAVLLRLDLGFAEQQIAELGGHLELARVKKSLYPYFFSRREEAGIERRLRQLG
jgi:hypothetical protein